MTPTSFPAGSQHSCAKGTGFFLLQEGQAVPGGATSRDAEPGPTWHLQVGSLGLGLRLPLMPFPHVICTLGKREDTQGKPPSAGLSTVSGTGLCVAAGTGLQEVRGL